LKRGIVLQELVYLNGWIGSFEDSFISVNDRGYNFGDGIYEVVRVYNGVPFAVVDHLERLENSAAAIEMTIPWSRVQLAMFTEDLLLQSGIKEAIIYIQISRGTAHRNHLYDPQINPNLLITVRQVPEIARDIYTDGVKIITQPEFRWQLCHIKSTSLLSSVLAINRAAQAEAAEAVFVMEDGTVTECSTSNIFIYSNKALLTHPANNRILSGITRKYVLQAAHSLGINTREETFTSTELLAADEVFFTNSVAEVVPVIKVDDHIIGSGAPGPVANQIHTGFITLRNAGV